jgi:hypothetical protein
VKEVKPELLSERSGFCFSHINTNASWLVGANRRRNVQRLQRAVARKRGQHAAQAS